MKGAYAYQTLLQYLSPLLSLAPMTARLTCGEHLLLFFRASPGNRLPLGSDFPVEGMNPLLGFYAAIARRSPEGTSPHGPGGWCVPFSSCAPHLWSPTALSDHDHDAHRSRRYAAEALTRTQALRGMTRDAAYACFTEETRGQLAPGFAADFVVLDRDIMRVPLEEILHTKVLATVVDGQVAYGSL